MNDLNNYQIVGKNSADKKEKVYKLNTEQKKVKLVEIMEEAREIFKKAEELRYLVKEKVKLLKQGEKQLNNAIINPIQPIIGCKFLIMP